MCNRTTIRILHHSICTWYYQQGKSYRCNNGRDVDDLHIGFEKETIEETEQRLNESHDDSKDKVLSSGFLILIDLAIDGMITTFIRELLIMRTLLPLRTHFF